uniref:PHD-type domain-containing protein n=1 Tax=Acrobeloides nanus TaxID=290746 RepID=A0A914EDW3_9BILA
MYANTGKHYWVENSAFFGVHESCLHLSEKLKKNRNIIQTPLTQYLGGYALEDIFTEFKRSSSQKCTYCSRLGAPLKCCVKQCSKVFHFVCGIRSGANYDYKASKIYCLEHSPFKPVALTTEQESCLFCQNPVKKMRVPREIVETNCCGSHYYHFSCFLNSVKAMKEPLKCFYCQLEEKYTNFCESVCQQSIYIPSEIACFENDLNNNTEEIIKPIYFKNSKIEGKNLSVVIEKQNVPLGKLKKYVQKRSFDLQKDKNSSCMDEKTENSDDYFDFYVMEANRAESASTIQSRASEMDKENEPSTSKKLKELSRRSASYEKPTTPSNASRRSTRISDVTYKKAFTRVAKLESSTNKKLSSDSSNSEKHHKYPTRRWTLITDDTELDEDADSSSAIIDNPDNLLVKETQPNVAAPTMSSVTVSPKDAEKLSNDNIGMPSQSDILGVTDQIEITYNVDAFYEFSGRMLEPQLISQNDVYIRGVNQPNVGSKASLLSTSSLASKPIVQQDLVFESADSSTFMANFEPFSKKRTRNSAEDSTDIVAMKCSSKKPRVDDINKDIPKEVKISSANDAPNENNDEQMAAGSLESMESDGLKAMRLSDIPGMSPSMLDYFQ